MQQIDIIYPTGTLHEQSFACACRPLTNCKVAREVVNLHAARGLVNGRQTQANACPCRVPVPSFSKFFKLNGKFRSKNARAIEISKCVENSKKKKLSLSYRKVTFLKLLSNTIRSKTMIIYTTTNYQITKLQIKKFAQEVDSPLN